MIIFHTHPPLTFSFWSLLFRFHSKSWRCFHSTQTHLISSHCIIFHCIEKLFIQFPIAGYLLLHRMLQWISLDIAKILVILKDGIVHILFEKKSIFVCAWAYIYLKLLESVGIRNTRYGESKRQFELKSLQCLKWVLFLKNVTGTVKPSQRLSLNTEKTTSFIFWPSQLLVHTSVTDRVLPSCLPASLPIHPHVL